MEAEAEVEAEVEAVLFLQHLVQRQDLKLNQLHSALYLNLTQFKLKLVLLHLEVQVSVISNKLVTLSL